MRFLSNLFSRPSAKSTPLATNTVTPDQLNAAMESLLATPHQRPETEQMILFMQGARARGMDVMQTRVATRGKTLSYALLPSVMPGRTLMLIGGTPRNSTQSADAQLLISKVVDQYADHDLAMMETLLDPGDYALADIYAANGFQRLAELIYMECPARPGIWNDLPGFALETYTPSNEGDFAAAIRASYEGTLDCPALNGVRTMEDTLASHKSAGKFDPANWFLIRQHGLPVGIMLLATIPATDATDLVYIGLAKAARGQGIAGKLVKMATWRAAELSCRRLTTAVDSHNTPAIRLYTSAGMQRIGSRVAMVKVIHREQPISSTIHPQARI